jgi:hypothetical protein
MLEVTVQCTGIPIDSAQSGVDAILEEFQHRPWHTNVRCQVDAGALVLTAVNEHDPQGLALLDEFSDTVVASLELGEATVSFQVLSVSPLGARG